MKISLLTTILLVTISSLLFAAEEPHAKRFPPDPPDMPAYSLPDPLLTTGGQKVANADDWRKIRRPEVLELFRKHVYGRVPATAFRQSFRIVHEDPKAMGGAATLRQVEIHIEAGEKSLLINLTLFVPNKRSGPAPTFLLISNRGAENIDPTREKKSGFWPAEEGIARGYAMAAFNNADVDPDNYDGFKNGIHGLLDGATRPSDAWGTIAAWAWGASHCLDYLVTDKDIAKDKVAVIGHSRGGKTALWAAAEDERFAMACSNDSGCVGAALSRRQKKNKETVPVINKSFPHWFNANFKTYNDRVEELPVDQHMLIALIAPRAVCVGSASQDFWADPRGEFESAVRAGPVYQLFNKSGLGDPSDMPFLDTALHGDGVHYHIREGKHNLTPLDWGFYMDFADKQWRKSRATE
jgi:pimeloyl-ACP methyl ester carboxylesterase